MAIEYVDKKGLSHFWEKIKSAVRSKKAEVTPAVTSGTKIATVDGVDIFAPVPSGGTLYAAPGAKKSVYNFDMIDGNAHFLMAVGENYGDQTQTSSFILGFSIDRCDGGIDEQVPYCVSKVDWGDGKQTLTPTASLKHTYAKPGIYEVILYSQSEDIKTQYASEYMQCFSNTMSRVFYGGNYMQNGVGCLAASVPDGVEMNAFQSASYYGSVARLLVLQGGVSASGNPQFPVVETKCVVRLIGDNPIFQIPLQTALMGGQPNTNDYILFCVPYIYKYVGTPNFSWSQYYTVIETENLPLKSITIPDTTVNVSDYIDSEATVHVPVLLNEKNDVNYNQANIQIAKYDDPDHVIKSISYSMSREFLPRLEISTNASVKDGAKVNITLKAVGSGISYTGTLTFINKRSKLTKINCRTTEITFNKSSELDLEYIGDGVYPVAIADRGVTAEVVAGTGTVHVTDGKVLVTATDGDSITVRVTSTSNPSISTEAVLKVNHQIVSINLNSQWQAKEGSTVDGHQVYQSFSNYHVGSGRAKAILTLSGYAAGSTVKLYIRSYAESNWDYVIVGRVNQTLDNNASYNSSSVLAHTRGHQSATTYTEVDLVTQTDSDTVEIVYLKDGGGDANDDRGYFYIDAPISDVTA